MTDDELDDQQLKKTLQESLLRRASIEYALVRTKNTERLMRVFSKLHKDNPIAHYFLYLLISAREGTEAAAEHLKAAEKCDPNISESFYDWLMQTLETVCQKRKLDENYIEAISIYKFLAFYFDDMERFKTLFAACVDEYFSKFPEVHPEAKTLVLEVDYRCKEDLAGFEKLQTANFQMLAVSRFDGSSNNIYATIDLTPETFLPLHTLLFHQVEIRRHVRVTVNGIGLSGVHEGRIFESLAELLLDGLY